MTEEVYKNWVKRSSRSKENFIALKQRKFIDEINNFFMNSYWSKTGIFVKLMRKVSKKWKNWRSFRVQPSTLLQDEDQSKIRILFWNSLVRYSNCKMKLIVWMTREIFKMLNQYAVDISTLTVNLCLSHLIQFLGNAKPFYRKAEPQRRAAKHLGHAWYIGKRFCRSSCVLHGTSSAGIEYMKFGNIRTNSLINGGEERESNSNSRSEMPIWTVSENFSHP